VASLWSALSLVKPASHRLGWAARLLGASAAVHVIALLATGGEWSGAVSFRKPITFGVSVGLLLWTCGPARSRTPYGVPGGTVASAATACRSQTVSMRTRRPRLGPVPQSAFAGFRFPPEVIVLAVRCIDGVLRSRRCWPRPPDRVATPWEIAGLWTRRM